MTLGLFGYIVLWLMTSFPLLLVAKLIRLAIAHYEKGEERLEVSKEILAEIKRNKKDSNSDYAVWARNNPGKSLNDFYAER